MAVPRFLLESIPAIGGVAWLDRDESRHAIGSRRLAEGDAVELIDGCGGVAQARLQNQRNNAGNIAATVESLQRLARISPALHVGSAVPKGDRLSMLLDAAGELAVETITALACERSVTPAERMMGERSERILAEALKQSRGSWRTELRTPTTPIDFANASIAVGHSTFILDARGKSLAPLAAHAPRIALLIGPEGGFTENEYAQMLQAGAIPASLGEGVLRVELAVAVACGAIRSNA